MKRGVAMRWGRWAVWMLPAVAAWAMVGCPTYDDDYSGRYVEVAIDELQDEAVAIELFRFGAEVRAVMRRYDIASVTAREDPFNEANEVECRWSRVDRFDVDERRFSLIIPGTERHEAIALSGQIDQAGQMEVTIGAEGAEESRQVTLRPSGAAADGRCATIDDFFVRATFDDGGASGLDRDTYELRNPVFALLWASVEPVNRGGFTEWVALNRVEPAIRLRAGGQFDRPGNALRGSLSLNVPPPADQILVESGQTRYGLAHFVVIDDSEEEGRFNWVVGDEPLVATSLERGTPDDAPAGGDEINGWGKGLLFVEGRLNELHRDLRLRFEGLADAEQSRHFYIVDVFFYNDEVVGLRLPPRPAAGRPVQRRVALQTTDRYLEAGEVLLPRLFPY